MRNNRFFQSIVFVLIAGVLVGCAHKAAPTQEEIERQGEQLQKLARSRSVDIVTDHYLGAKAIPLETDQSTLGMRVTLRSKGSLASLGNTLSNLTSLAVHISDTDPDPLPTSSSASDKPNSLELPGLPHLLTPPTGSGPGRTLSVNYEGPLHGLLDQLSSQSGYGWDYDARSNSILFARVMVRTYTLFSVPGNVQHENEITNKSKDNIGSNSIGGNNIGQTVSRNDTSTQTAQSNKIDLKYNVWVDTEKVVKSLLSKQGSVVANQGAGTLTVRDRPENIRQVTAFIRDTNLRLSRTVALNVRVWSLEVSDDNEAGLDLQMIFNDKNVSVVAGSLSALGNLGTSSATIVSGKLKDSGAVIKALKQWGDATQITSAGVVAMNNHPEPIEAVKSHAYLAGASISQADYGQTSQVTPGEVVTGFSMTVIPHILDKRRVVLHYNVKLSSLDAMEEFKANEVTVQLPQVSTRTFSQRCPMQMGQTLVLAGFQQVTQTRSSSLGMFSAGRKAGYGKTLLVITIELEGVSGGMEASTSAALHKAA